MSRNTRIAGLSYLLALMIVATASLAARLYKEQQDSVIAQAQMLATTSIACVTTGR